MSNANEGIHPSAYDYTALEALVTDVTVDIQGTQAEGMAHVIAGSNVSSDAIVDAIPQAQLGASRVLAEALIARRMRATDETREEVLAAVQAFGPGAIHPRFIDPRDIPFDGEGELL